MNCTNEELLGKIISISNRVGIPSESNELIDLREEALLRMARGTNTLAVDETICSCSHDKYENPNKPGHCMACGKPFCH